MQDVDEVCNASRNKKRGVQVDARGFIDKKHEQDKKKARPNHSFKDERGEVAGTMLFTGIPWQVATVFC